MPIYVIWLLVYIAMGLALLDSSSNNPIKDILFWIVPITIMSLTVIVTFILIIVIIIVSPIIQIFNKRE